MSRPPTATGGPKTPRGQAAASRNALTHGLRSTLPVLPGIERERDWKAYRSGVFRAVDPAGEVESLLAERIALVSWRLRRVVRYETAMAASDEHSDDPASSEFVADPADTADPADSADDFAPAAADALRRAELRRQQLDHFVEQPDDALLPTDQAIAVLTAVNDRASGFSLNSFTVPGIPPGQPLDQYGPWTAGLVRRAIHAIGTRVGKDPNALLDDAVYQAHRWVDEERRRRAHLLAAAAQRRRAADRQARARHLPPPEAVERVIRYEAHLARQLYAALHELEAWRSRAGRRPQPAGRLQPTGPAES